MNFNTYQETVGVIVYPKVNGVPKLFYDSLAICEEAGEVAGKIKKIIRDKNSVVSEEDRLAILKELSDILYYISDMSVEFNSSLESVAEIGIKKLQDRQKRGVIQGSGDNR